MWCVLLGCHVEFLQNWNYQRAYGSCFVYSQAKDLAMSNDLILQHAMTSN